MTIARDSSPPQCLWCAHLKRSLAVEDFPEMSETFTCSAFPDSIPRAIFANAHDHREAFEGDQGIRFEVLSADERERLELDEPNFTELFGTNG